MEVNIYLKAFLHSLIFPFTDWVTQYVKKGMCFCLEILNTFSVLNVFWSCMMLSKALSAKKESWES